MKLLSYRVIGLLGFGLLLSGCVVRSYSVTKDRVDQDLSGNQGFLKGAPTESRTKERKATRTSQVVEIELYNPIKFEKAGKPKGGPVVQAETSLMPQDTEAMGNRGFIMSQEAPMALTPEAPEFEKYTVQKGDTLQKISQKFFGTTKKWHKIYAANQDTLKGPDKIYPGMVINIPVQPSQGMPEHLK